MNQLRLLRLPEVMDVTGLSRSGVYADPELARVRIKISDRAAGYPSDAVEAWVKRKIAQSRSATR